MTNETHGKLAWGTTILGVVTTLITTVTPILPPPYGLVAGAVITAVGSIYQASTHAVVNSSIAPALSPAAPSSTQP